MIVVEKVDRELLLLPASDSCIPSPDSCLILQKMAANHDVDRMLRRTACQQRDKTCEPEGV
jgi:hypothetical protein